MFSHYLKIARRTLWRNPGYSAIHVLGLSVGIACCILIALYLQEELSYDDFHEHDDRIIYVGTAYSRGGGEATCCGGGDYGIAHYLETQVPQVEQATRKLRFNRSGNVRRGDVRTFERENITHADSSFFEIFSFPLLRGDPSEVLDEPNSVVITRSKAETYFGDENPIGKTLTIDGYGQQVTATVTGVTTVPERSSITFDFMLSVSSLPAHQREPWKSGGIFESFALLQPGTSVDALQRSLRPVEEERLMDQPSLTETLKLVPLSELYLSGRTSRDGFRARPEYLYIFGAIAIFVLLLACTNYVNLATARAASRSDEVAIRKASGAISRDLIGQFIGEAVLLAGIAYVVGLALAWTALPVFNSVFGTDLALISADHLTLLAGLLGLALLAGILAGSYPAFYLARFEPTTVLRDRAVKGAQGSILRSGLIVLQFAVSATLIVGTLVVWQQLQYVQAKDLGFRIENMVVMETRSDPMQRQYRAVTQQLEQHPGILEVTASSGTPSDFWHTYTFDPESGPPDRQISFKQISADFDFAEVYDLEVLAGRFFSRNHPSDTARAVVLNEEAVSEIGWPTPQEAIGRELSYGAPYGEPPRTVVGVVANFHYSSLREEIGPVVIDMKRPGRALSYPQYTVRIREGGTSQALAHMESVYQRFPNERPFQYGFLEEQYEQMYRTERRLATAFSAFAVIALLIAAFGLLGLAAYIAQQRTKEIGIRKVLGATAERIAGLLSWDFMRLVAVGMLIATPVGYLLMGRWLERFAYRIELSPSVFIWAGVIVGAIAVGTVSYHAIRAALRSPTDSLRYE